MVAKLDLSHQREECRLELSEKRVLRKLFGSESEKRRRLEKNA
jgi:hypothetical protein